MATASGRIVILAHAALFFSLILFSINGLAQSSTGILRGQVLDASTGRSLPGVSIQADSSAEAAVPTITIVDGSYRLRLREGRHSLYYSLPGFQSKQIGHIDIHPGRINYADIILFPLAQRSPHTPTFRSSNDSLPEKDSIFRTSLASESRLRRYNPISWYTGIFGIVPVQDINPGMDINATGIMKRLAAVVAQDESLEQDFQSLHISGMSARYNQILLNGVLLNSFDPLTRAYPLDLLPAEAIEEIRIRRTDNSSLPADHAGGTVMIRTRDFPDRNFFYIRAGGELREGANGKHFWGDKRNRWEPLSFPGATRDLSPEFPTTRSASFNQKNLQERIDLSRTLKNNLAPKDYGAISPDARFLIGFGRILNIRKGKQLGITGFISQSRTERIEESTVQMIPAVSTNPYPFADPAKQLISTQSTDMNYRYNSQFSGTLTASIRYGHNKISLTNFIGNELTDLYSPRSPIVKSDEDTLAHSGIHYATTQRTFINNLFSGEHALGANGKFKLEWRAGYSYYRILQPDERNFLLRQDSTDKSKYEIAHPSAPPPPSNPNAFDPNLTNSARLWRDQIDNDFEGTVNISAPFNLFAQAQVISGGIDIQSVNRKFHSDLLQTSGPGYYPLSGLLARERYYPGGLTVSNYFEFTGDFNNIYPNVRGNYTASSTLGAAHLRFETKLTRRLSLDLGGRLESSSRLVSNVQYVYATGFRYPQTAALDKNTYVDKVDFLPSIRLALAPSEAVTIHAAWSRTLNRPELQELTAYRYYDAKAFLVNIGNINLQRTLIDNYDAGVRWVPSSAMDISITGYYKRIDQPIENILSAYTPSSLISQPYNSPEARVIGANLHFRISLAPILSAPWLSSFSVFGDGDWLNSKVKAGPVRLTNPVAQHTLEGSPDHTVNAGLVFSPRSLPAITVLYNRSGDYLAVLGSGKAYTVDKGRSITAIPDYRVKGREQLDLRLSQKFFRSNLEITLGANNLLNQAYVTYQDLNGNNKFDAPLSLKTVNGKGGYFQGGIDSTPDHRRSQRTWYATVSYLFR